MYNSSVSKISFLLYALFVVGFSLLFVVPFTYASDWYISSGATSTGSNVAIGNSASNIGRVTWITATSTIELLNFDVYVKRHVNASDFVYGVVAIGSSSNATSGTLTIIATSTNWYSASQIATSTFTLLNFNLNELLLDFGTTTNIFVGFRRTVAGSISNLYYSNYINNTGTSTGFNTSNVLGSSNGAYTFISLLVRTPEEGWSCAEGYECYTLEEMATTTLAVQQGVMTLSLYLAFFLFFVALVVGYKFTKLFF